MMKKLIIELYDGLMAGVYADSYEPIDIQVIDNDDRYDEERAAEYSRAMQLIERGVMADIYNRPAAEESEPETAPPAMRDPRALLLVPDIYEAKTEGGRSQQQLDVAFIDGFLNAWGRITRYILGLNRSCNAEDREKARLLQKYLEPVMQKMETDYTAFCGKVVDPNAYDQGESPEECASVEPQM